MSRSICQFADTTLPSTSTLDLHFVGTRHRLRKEDLIELEIAIGARPDEHIVIIASQVISTLFDRHGYHLKIHGITQNLDLEKKGTSLIVAPSRICIQWHGGGAANSLDSYLRSDSWKWAEVSFLKSGGLNKSNELPSTTIALSVSGRRYAQLSPPRTDPWWYNRRRDAAPSARSGTSESSSGFRLMMLTLVGRAVMTHPSP
jgi:hypothetical protein